VFAAPQGFVLYLPKPFTECGIQPRFRVLGLHKRFQAELPEANYRPCGHDQMGQLMQKAARSCSSASSPVGSMRNLYTLRHGIEEAIRADDSIYNKGKEKANKVVCLFFAFVYTIIRDFTRPRTSRAMDQNRRRGIPETLNACGLRVSLAEASIAG
jgi:hypothetical protein